jgi:hypothetical protein
LELYEGFEEVPVLWKANMYHYLAKRSALTCVFLEFCTQFYRRLMRTGFAKLNFSKSPGCCCFLNSIQASKIQNPFGPQSTPLGPLSCPTFRFCGTLEVSTDLFKSKNIAAAPLFGGISRGLELSYGIVFL